jgi:hypothetical protein
VGTDIKSHTIRPRRHNMNIYLISQDENSGYDTHDSAVVCAKSPKDAKEINPGYGEWGDTYPTWASSPSKVKCKKIGETNRKTQGVILASFNAG